MILDPDRDLRADRVELLLDEAATAERARPPVDSERFLARLRSRIIPFAPRRQLSPALAIAALVPIILVLWLVFGGFGPPRNGLRGDESELIAELDVLELLAKLTPEEIEKIDPALFELYLNWELIDELPVEILGNS